MNVNIAVVQLQNFRIGRFVRGMGIHPSRSQKHRDPCLPHTDPYVRYDWCMATRRTIQFPTKLFNFMQNNYVGFCHSLMEDSGDR